MLTMKGKYGLKAALHLAKLPPDELALSSEIAAANGVSKKFLDAILNDLRVAGLVVTRRGRAGGYRLARSPAEIMAGDVMRVLDGPIAPIACASRRYYRPCHDCSDEATCAVRLIMARVRDAIADVLEGTSLEELARLGDGQIAPLVALAEAAEAKHDP